MLLLGGCGLLPVPGAGPELNPPPTPGSPPSSATPVSSPSPAETPALATLYGNGHDDNHGGAKFEIVGLERVSATSVAARFRISPGSREVRLGNFHDSGLAGNTVYGKWLTVFSGFYLLDHSRLAAYYPMRKEDTDTGATCLCSYIERATLTREEPALLWAVYQVPPETTGVAVGFHHAGLTATLPISLAGTGVKLDGEPDAAAADAAFPTTVTLATRLADPAASVAESDDQVEIALNTDVLFDFDKATLTPKARETLRRTADRISAEARGTVQIVGHTDDVGEDGYNLALSLRRAKAVERSLAALVPDAAFRTEGKGETEPAAEGSSDQTRARNRRVQVVFERAATPGPGPTPAAVPKETSDTPAGEATATPGTAVASATGLRELTGLTADLLELRRISDKALIATVGFEHTGDGAPVRLEEGALDQDDDEIGSMVGSNVDFFWLTLTGANATRYLPLTNAGNPHVLKRCVCSTTTRTTIGPGERIRMFVLMTAPPAGVTSVDVNLFGFTPMKGVPFSG
ncbi:OmpA family protein [Nonomuraea sp. NPDC048826]|uniref:OmpA family protein n=1 Tax=Nonomuraea sp. NPDC048826 TaxID=3364347 RepID=UPI003721912F